MASIDGSHSKRQRPETATSRISRDYQSTARKAAALRTRAAVVKAAAEVFAREGYRGAKIDQIATLAKVSRPTLFAVGNKAHLFSLARQDAITGGQLSIHDDQFEALLKTADPRQLLREFARFAAAISRRLGPLQLVLEQGAETEPDLAQILEASQQELRACAESIVSAVAAAGELRGDMPADACADVLWLQLQAANYRILVGVRGWSHDAFASWLADIMITSLLDRR